MFDLSADKVTFVVVDDPRLETDFKTKAVKKDKNGNSRSIYKVIAHREGQRLQTLNVKVVGEPAAVKVMDKVRFDGLGGFLYKGKDDPGDTSQRISLTAKSVKAA
jgi:hypothetical protein